MTSFCGCTRPFFVAAEAEDAGEIEEKLAFRLVPAPHEEPP
jgi:hypothetical protein